MERQTDRQSNIIKWVNVICFISLYYLYIYMYHLDKHRLYVICIRVYIYMFLGIQTLPENRPHPPYHSPNAQEAWLDP